MWKCYYQNNCEQSKPAKVRVREFLEELDEETVKKMRKMENTNYYELKTKFDV